PGFPGEVVHNDFTQGKKSGKGEDF
ncbi:MAG: hypothetical protein RLZZ148_3084, partial [Cyanobacteriota bacterium]